MKITLKNVKEIREKSDNRLEQYVLDDLIDHCEGFDTKKEQDKDLEAYIRQTLDYGCASGNVHDLIYYIDTTAFFEEYKPEINALLSEMLSELDEPVENILKDWDTEDPLVMGTHNQNLLAWYGYEVTLRNIYDTNFEDSSSGYDNEEDIEDYVIKDEEGNIVGMNPGYEELDYSDFTRYIHWGMNGYEVLTFADLHKNGTQDEKAWIEDVFEYINFHEENSYLCNSREDALKRFVYEDPRQFYWEYDKDGNRIWGPKNESEYMASQKGSSPYESPADIAARKAGCTKDDKGDNDRGGKA